MTAFRYLVALVLASLIGGCSVTTPESLEGWAFATDPDELIPSFACDVFASFEPGPPLDGYSLANDRMGAVQAAMRGHVVDRAALRQKYDDLVARAESLERAFDDIGQTVGLGENTPLSIAEMDWNRFSSAIIDQRNATERVFDFLERVEADVPSEAIAFDPVVNSEYRSLAVDWIEAQYTLFVSSLQLRWTHDRAVDFLSPTCTGLPRFEAVDQP